jgi:hypothetical protein
MAQKKKNKKNETLEISFEQAIEDLTGIVIGRESRAV